MKRILATLALFAATLAMGAEPATIKEAFAKEAAWKVNEQLFSDPLMGTKRHQSLLTKESGQAFLSRLANSRSDEERKFAAKIAKANIPTLETIVLTPAEKVAGAQAPKIQAIRKMVEKIAASPSAQASDLSELRRLVDSLPAR